MSVKRLYHARHNESVCHSLCGDENNADWIVITAFYAALHFVEYKLFPIKFRDNAGNKVVIKSFEIYYSHHYPNNTPNKHAVMADLVRQKLKMISANYNWLKSLCYTTRYFEYQLQTPGNIIAEAKRRLAEIKEICEG